MGNKIDLNSKGKISTEIEIKVLSWRFIDSLYFNIYNIHVTYACVVYYLTNTLRCHHCPLDGKRDRSGLSFRT